MLAELHKLHGCIQIILPISADMAKKVNRSSRKSNAGGTPCVKYSSKQAV